jgi:hypothetical protein
MQGLEMKYFVLKPKGSNAYAAASRTAMNAYARAIKYENPSLSRELLAWAEDETAKAVTSEENSK